VSQIASQVPAWLTPKATSSTLYGAGARGVRAGTPDAESNVKHPIQVGQIAAPFVLAQWRIQMGSRAPSTHGTAKSPGDRRIPDSVHGAEMSLSASTHPLALSKITCYVHVRTSSVPCAARWFRQYL